MARKTPVEVYRQPLAMQGTPDDAHLAAPCSSTPINKMPLTRLIKQSTIMTQSFSLTRSYGEWQDRSILAIDC